MEGGGPTKTPRLAGRKTSIGVEQEDPAGPCPACRRANGDHLRQTPADGPDRPALCVLDDGRMFAGGRFTGARAQLPLAEPVPIGRPRVQIAGDGHVLLDPPMTHNELGSALLAEGFDCVRYEVIRWTAYDDGRPDLIDEIRVIEVTITNPIEPYGDGLQRRLDAFVSDLATAHGITNREARDLAAALLSAPADPLSLGPADEVRRQHERSDGVLLDRVRSTRRAVDRGRRVALGWTR